MGLLISEGTQPSDDGQGYMRSPGIYTDHGANGYLIHQFITETSMLVSIVMVALSKNVQDLLSR